MNPHAAGVDLGAREHWVAVPQDRHPQAVRGFGTFTADLEALADWLKECRITSVAMEATGVYWIPLFQLLERRGFAVLLVNARQIKNVSGRKSDVLDCQWIQRLHAYGLLGGSLRPADAYCVVRSYLRYRDELVAARSTQTQHMQKSAPANEHPIESSLVGCQWPERFSHHCRPAPGRAPAAQTGGTGRSAGQIQSESDRQGLDGR